jgi:excisionase family DNA binding protein
MGEDAGKALGIGEAAARLGLSRQRVYQLLEEGRLRPIAPGEKMFSAAEVERVRSVRKQPKKIRTPAALMLEAAALFEKGTDLVSCVRELGLGPTKVRNLYDEWRTPLGGVRKLSLVELSKESEAEHDRFNREMDEKIAQQRKDADAAHANVMKLLLGSNGRTSHLSPKKA